MAAGAPMPVAFCFKADPLSPDNKMCRCAFVAESLIWPPYPRYGQNQAASQQMLIHQPREIPWLVLFYPKERLGLYASQSFENIQDSNSVCVQEE
jgi:hypothetical protein